MCRSHTQIQLPMKKLLSAVVAAAFAGPCANGAVITWQLPATIRGASDVSTQGGYFGSWAPYNGNSTATPVNGVTFQGFSDLPSLSGSSFEDGGNYWGTSTPDANYNSLLGYGAYGTNSDSKSFSWGGMTPGDTYLVQLWISDPRTIGVSRAATVSGDGDTSAVINYPADGTGPGNYIIGTFVAGPTGTQTITIDPSQDGNPNAGSAQLNLFQVRNITVPEPASATLLGIGMLGFLTRRRRA